MALFLYTATLICHPQWSQPVQQALAGFPAFNTTVLDSTPIRLERQLHHHVVLINALLSNSESTGDAMRRIVSQVHPTVHRFTGQPITDYGEDLRRDDSWWLPEISVALITNDTHAAQQILDYHKRTGA